MKITLQVSYERGTAILRLYKDLSFPTAYKEFTCSVSVGGREYYNVGGAHA